MTELGKWLRLLLICVWEIFRTKEPVVLWLILYAWNVQSQSGERNCFPSYIYDLALSVAKWLVIFKIFYPAEQKNACKISECYVHVTGRGRNSVHSSMTGTISSRASNFLSSLPPQARGPASHPPTRFLIMIFKRVNFWCTESVWMDRDKNCNL